MGVIVNDLPAAKAFFLDLRLELLEEGKLQEAINYAAVAGPRGLFSGWTSKSKKFSDAEL